MFAKLLVALSRSSSRALRALRSNAETFVSAIHRNVCIPERDIHSRGAVEGLPREAHSGLELGHRRVRAIPVSRVGLAECAAHCGRSDVEGGDLAMLVVVLRIGRLCKPQRHTPEDV